jgi:hypothetical protein
MSNVPIFVFNELVFNGTSMAADINSSSIDISESVGYCAHFVWTGSPVGNVIIKGSNDNNNFVQVASQATAGTAGQFLANVEHVHYRYLKVSYSRTSGSGSLTCHVSSKRE